MNVNQIIQTGVDKQIFPEITNVVVVSAKGKETRETQWGPKTQQWVLLKDNVPDGQEAQTIAATVEGHPELAVGTKFTSIKSVSGKHGLRGVAFSKFMKRDGTEGVSLRITGSAWLGIEGAAPSFNGKPIAAKTTQTTFTNNKTQYTLEEIVSLNNYFMTAFDTTKDIIARAILASKAAACAQVVGLKAETKVTSQTIKTAINETFGSVPGNGLSHSAPLFDDSNEIPF